MERAETRGESVYRLIKADILNGHLLPGQKLAFADLGQRYAAGTGVLREVLPRLVERGFATTEPQLGYRVVSVSVADLRELTEARIQLETLAFRLSVGQGDLQWESTVVACHHQLARLPNMLDSQEINPDWLAAHTRFHKSLLEGCKNRWLRETADNLREIAEVYRCWAMTSPSSLSRDIAGEHRHLADAAVARDADLAVSILTYHISTTTDLLAKARTSNDASDGRADTADTGVEGGLAEIPSA